MKEPSDIGIKTKPAFGEKCNGCGVCCRASLCPVAEIAGIELGENGCPLQEEVDGSITCGMFKIEAEYRNVYPMSPEIVGDLLGSGGGCDCRILGYAPDDNLPANKIALHQLKQIENSVAIRDKMVKIWPGENGKVAKEKLLAQILAYGRIATIQNRV